VSGATGFVGYHTAAELRAGGHAVRALVRDPGKGERVLGPLGIGPGDLAPGDMTDSCALRAAIDGCDAVVHAAAAVSVTKGEADFETNVRGTQVVLGAAAERALPSVHLSSLEVIMAPGEPTTESSTPTERKTRYGRSKAEADRWVRARQGEGAPIAIVYPSGVVGPGDPGFSESVKAYRSFLRGMLGTGATQFVDCRDLSRLIVRLLETGHAGRVIAAGHYFRWDELRELLGQLTGARIPRIAAPGWLLRGGARALDLVGRISGRRMPMTGEGIEIATRWRRVDDSKIVSELGIAWRPPEETLADQFRWYVEVGRLPASAVPALNRN